MIISFHHIEKNFYHIVYTDDFLNHSWNNHFYILKEGPTVNKEQLRNYLLKLLRHIERKRIIPLVGTQNCPKNSFSCPVTHTRTFVHQGQRTYAFRKCSIKKGVLRNFWKFRGKHLCQSFFFNNFIKKDTLTQVFSSEFWEISKNTFFTEHLWAVAFAGGKKY